MGAGLDTLIVDKDMGLLDLADMFWAMKGVTGGDGKSMNMPISGSTGGNLVWDKAKVKTAGERAEERREGHGVGKLTHALSRRGPVAAG